MKTESTIDTTDINANGSIREVDERLIRRVLRGKPELFTELIEKYQDRLFNTLLRITGCPAESEDVVQEAFMQTLMQLDRFRFECSYYSWLYRIALNIARTKARRRRREISLDGFHAHPDHDPVCRLAPPEKRMESNEERSELEHAMAKLDDPFRAILILREIEGCSYTTIGNMLELPMGTVKSRLYRARIHLRDILTKPVL